MLPADCCSCFVVKTFDFFCIQQINHAIIHVFNTSNLFTGEMCNFQILNRSCGFRRCVTRPYVMAVEGSVWLRLVSWCCLVWRVDMHVTVLPPPSRYASHQFSRHAKQIPLSALTLDVRAPKLPQGSHFLQIKVLRASRREEGKTSCSSELF